MSLSVDTLGSALEGMIPVEDTNEGISHFADAFLDYFVESEVGVAPAVRSALAPCRAAMVEAMEPVASADAAAAIGAGVSAFWAALAPIVASVWITIPPLATLSVTPPGLGGIAAAVLSVGVANIEGRVEMPDAAHNMAGAIHPGNLGGFVTDTTTPTPLTIAIL